MKNDTQTNEAHRSLMIVSEKLLQSGITELEAREVFQFLQAQAQVAIAEELRLLRLLLENETKRGGAFNR